MNKDEAREAAEFEAKAQKFREERSKAWAEYIDLSSEAGYTIEDTLTNRTLFMGGYESGKEAGAASVDRRAIVEKAFEKVKDWTLFKSTDATRAGTQLVGEAMDAVLAEGECSCDENGHCNACLGYNPDHQPAEPKCADECEPMPMIKCRCVRGTNGCMKQHVPPTAESDATDEDFKIEPISQHTLKVPVQYKGQAEPLDFTEPDATERASTVQRAISFMREFDHRELNTYEWMADFLESETPRIKADAVREFIAEFHKELSARWCEFTSDHDAALDAAEETVKARRKEMAEVD